MEGEMRRLVRWYGDLPIGIVGPHAMFLGLLFIGAELDGWIDWGVDASLLMTVPVVLWAMLQR
jgi:hypothetical protein